MRYALVNANDVVVNVIELEDTAQYTPATGLTLVAGRDWPAPPAPPPLPVSAPTFLAQDMLTLLTDDDCQHIQASIAGNISLWRLWQSLLAQRDPIATDSDRFKTGWAGMTIALGSARADAIATALGIPTG